MKISILKMFILKMFILKMFILKMFILKMSPTKMSPMTSRGPRNLKRVSVVIALALALSGLVRADEVKNVEPYSWSFRNFKTDYCAPPPGYYTWDRYRETYIGVPPNPVINNGFDWLFFKAVYEQELAAAGNCFGLSLMSLQMNKKGGHLGFCLPVSQYSGDNVGVPPLMNSECNAMGRQRLGPTNQELRRAIEETHGHQVNLASVRYTMELISKKEVDGDAAYQQAVAHAPALVSIIKDSSSPFGNGHTLLVYDARPGPGDEKRLYVYDPNRSLAATNPDPSMPQNDQREWYEKGNNYIRIFGDGSWQFEMAGGTMWPDGSGLIWVTPVSVAGPRDRNPASMGLSITSLLDSIFLSGSAGTTLKQVYAPGGRYAFEPGTKKLELAPLTCLLEILPFFPSDGPRAWTDGKELYFFVVRPDGPRDFEVDTGGGDYELLVNTRHWSLRLSGKAGERAQDYVRVDGFESTDPQVLLLNTAAVASYDVDLFRVFEPGVSGRKFAVKNLVMDEDGVVDLRLSPNAEGILVSSPTGAISFDLELASVEKESVDEASVEDIRVGAGSVAQIQPMAWDDLREEEILGGGRVLDPGEIDDYDEIIFGGSVSGPIGPDFEASRDLGAARGGLTIYDADAGLYTQSSAGAGIGAEGDSCQFVYRRLHGDFEFRVELVDSADPIGVRSAPGVRGLMARLDASPASVFSQLQLPTGRGPEDRPRWAHRFDHGTAASFVDRLEADLDPDRPPRFMKLVRRDSTFYGFLSRDGKTWLPVGSNTWYGLDPGAAVMVGFASTTGEAPAAATTTFRVLHLGAIDPALPDPVPDDGLTAGQVVLEASFDEAGVLVPEGFSVQRRDGTFTPRLRDGRLQLLDAGAEGSSTSAFSEFIIEDAGEAIYQFDFDLYWTGPPGAEAGEGLSFVLAAGGDAALVGQSGPALGYEGLGQDPGNGREAPPNSFAVTFDARNDEGAFEGPGAPEDRPAPHVSINSVNQVAGIVETAEALSALYDDAGIHASVVYNRGEVSVFLAPNEDGREDERVVLSARVLPLSFSGDDRRAVFGWTASSSLRTLTAEVDNLTVTEVSCDDAQEVAEVIGTPGAPLAVGESVILDGSPSHGGAGDGSEAVSHFWEVVSGAAQIVGPDRGPTVTLKTTGSGRVVVRLTVDDGVCDNPGSTEVEFTVEGGPAGNWLLCDCNGDGLTDITDAVADLSWLFVGTFAPPCQQACDCDGNRAFEITDSIFELAYLFLGTTFPPGRFPNCDVFEGCDDRCPPDRR